MIIFPLFAATTSSFIFRGVLHLSVLTLFGMKTFVIATVNALTKIIYLKERSLRKRSMYLIINQAVADMLVGTSTFITCWFRGSACEFWTINLPRLPHFIFRTVSPTASFISLEAISLERTHPTFRPF